MPFSPDLLTPLNEQTFFIQWVIIYPPHNFVNSMFYVLLLLAFNSLFYTVNIFII